MRTPSSKYSMMIGIALGTDVKDIKVHEMNKLLNTVPDLAPHSDPMLARASSTNPGLRGKPSNSLLFSRSGAHTTRTCGKSEAEPDALPGEQTVGAALLELAAAPRPLVVRLARILGSVAR